MFILLRDRVNSAISSLRMLICSSIYVIFKFFITGHLEWYFLITDYKILIPNEVAVRLVCR